MQTYSVSIIAKELNGNNIPRFQVFRVDDGIYKVGICKDSIEFYNDEIHKSVYSVDIKQDSFTYCKVISSVPFKRQTIYNDGDKIKVFVDERVSISFEMEPKV